MMKELSFVRSKTKMDELSKKNQFFLVVIVRDSRRRRLKSIELEYLATDLIDGRFEGYDQILIDSDFNQQERYCGPDQNIEYSKEILADFHVDFVQHYERIRQHSNHIQLKNIKHENEGYYECLVRLHNGLVGVRVFFLSGKSSFMFFDSHLFRIDLVGGGPRQISNRETHIYSEVNDSIALLCPIYSSIPAWYTFILPDKSTITGQDYLRMKHLTHNHSGMYTCRVTTSEESEGYSLTANTYLDVYGKTFEVISPFECDFVGPPQYIEPYKKEYVIIPIEKTMTKIIHCSISGNPTPHYQWFSGDIKERNKEEILSDGTDYVIRGKANDTPESNRTMTCIAKNNRGSRRQVFILQFLD